MKNSAIVSIWCLCVLLPVTSSAGMSDQSWHFTSNEIDKKDFLSPIIINGIAYKPFSGSEYSCNNFTPQQVSFTLQYENKEPTIDTYGTGTVSKISDNTFKIEKVEKLYLRYPNGGVYILTNITNAEISGTTCDAGDTE